MSRSLFASNCPAILRDLRSGRNNERTAFTMRPHPPIYPLQILLNFCHYFLMRKFTAPILLALAVLLLSPTEGWSLPPCPGSPASGWKEIRTWTNCVGTYTYANGNKYVGEFRNAKYHGQGTYTYAGGAKYVGKFKDFFRHGQGTMTYPGGRVDEGIWYYNTFQSAKKAPSPRRARPRLAEKRRRKKKNALPVWRENSSEKKNALHGNSSAKKPV